MTTPFLGESVVLTGKKDRPFFLYESDFLKEKLVQEVTANK